MTPSTLDLQAIARAGGGLMLDASKYSTLDLQSIGRAGSSAVAALILKNPHSKGALDLQAIARAGGGKVIFDFS